MVNKSWRLIGQLNNHKTNHLHKLQTVNVNKPRTLHNRYCEPSIINKNDHHFPYRKNTADKDDKDALLHAGTKRFLPLVVR